MTEERTRVTLDLEKSLEEILENLARKFNKTKAQVIREGLVFLNNYILDDEKGAKWYKKEESNKEVGILLLGYAKL